MAGNIGDPLINYLDIINKDTIIILELSSFHLDDFVDMKLDIALLTNICNNHLDFYKTKQRYYLSKFKLTNNQNKSDYFIVNLNDRITKKYINHKPYNSKLIDYQLGFKINDNILYYYNKKVVNLNYYSLIGEHNLDNLKCVIVILSLLKIDLDINSLKNFKTLRYHLEELLINDNIVI